MGFLLILFTYFQAQAVLQTFPDAAQSVKTLRLATPNQITCFSEVMIEQTPQYLFIGENHMDYGAKDFIEKNLDVFKQQGFEFVFVEFLETSEQYVIDSFNRDPDKHTQDLLRTFAFTGHPGSWGYDSEDYFDLAYNIVQKDLYLVGLDRRTEYAFMLDSDKKFALRDQHMFDFVKAFIERYPDKKLIFFNGADHSYKRDFAGASFYELFVDSFPKASIMNLRVDYWQDVSEIRLGLAGQYKRLPQKCSTGFSLIKDNKYPQFDYYIFKENKDLFPVSDTGYGVFL